MLSFYLIFDVLVLLKKEKWWRDDDDDGKLSEWIDHMSFCMRAEIPRLSRAGKGREGTERDGTGFGKEG